MTPHSELAPLQIEPEGRQGLAFSCLFPGDWVRVPLPDESFDPDDPTAFLPLLVGMAPYGAVVFTVAARPAFDDGSVEDWAEYLASLQPLTIHSTEEARIGPHPALLITAEQESEAGQMQVRTAFVEDGGRLFNIGVMAPTAIWPSLEELLLTLLGSFRLASSAGPGAPLMRRMSSAPASVIGAESPAPAAVTAAPSVAEDESIVTEDPRLEADAAPDNVERATQPSEVALADDAASFDPEDPLNVRMRDNGVGLVPRIVQVSDSDRCATLAAGAIEATFRVPFGWHVIDDGKRTLVFDAGGRMQINLDLRPGTPQDYPALLEGILAGLQESNPGFEYLRLEIAGMPCLALRNLVIEGESLQQGYLVRESNRPEMALVCRVTANDEDITFALNTAEVILTSIQPPSTKPSAEGNTGEPAWWVEAQRLERADRLEEAEALLQKEIDHIGCYSQIAYLYELRLARLLSDGDREGARLAGENAARWLCAYASCATSGGEGAALSLERDQRIEAIRRALGDES